MTERTIFKILVLTFLCFSAPARSQSMLQIGSMSVRSLCISPDERTVAVETEAAEVSLWDVATRKKTTTLKRGKLKIETEDGDDMGFMSFGTGAVGRSFFTRNGKHLVVCNHQGVAVWALNNPFPVVEFFAPPGLYDVSRDEKHIAVLQAATEDNRELEPARISSQQHMWRGPILIYNVEGGAPKHIDLTINPFGELKGLRFIPNTNNILLLGSMGKLVIVDWTSGKILEEFELFQGEDESFEEMFSNSPPIRLAVHPQLPLAAVVRDQNLHLYDFKSHKIKQTIEVQKSAEMLLRYFEQIEFTPDNKYLFAASTMVAENKFQKIYQFWNIETGKEIKSIETQAMWSGYSFNKDGQWIALAHSKDFEKFSISIYSLQNLAEADVITGKGPLAFFSNDKNRLLFLSGINIAAYAIKAVPKK